MIMHGFENPKAAECVEWTDMSEGREVAGAVNTLMQGKVLTA
jgi:hypothetical protein